VVLGAAAGHELAAAALAIEVVLAADQDVRAAALALGRADDDAVLRRCTSSRRSGRGWPARGGARPAART